MNTAQDSSPNNSPDSVFENIIDNLKSGAAIYQAVNNGEDFVFIRQKQSWTNVKPSCL